MPFLLPYYCPLVSTKQRIRIHARRIRIQDSTKPTGSPDPYPESVLGPVSTDPDPDPAKPIANTSSVQHTPTIYRSRTYFETFSVPVPGLSAGSGYPGPDPPQVAPTLDPDPDSCPTDTDPHYRYQHIRTSIKIPFLLHFFFFLCFRSFYLFTSVLRSHFS